MSDGPTPAGAFVQGAWGCLYATVHPPKGDPGPGPRHGVVLVAPFMEERQDSHEVLRSLALSLSAAGFAVLRFDLFGTGDSDGDWDDATVQGWLDDLSSMRTLLRREAGVDTVGFVGLRFGATLAAYAAAQHETGWVGLVQPVLQGEAYAQEVLRAHLAAELVLHKKAGTTREALTAQLQAGNTVNLFGYGFTPAQFREMSTLDVGRALHGWAGDVLVVEVARTATARQGKELTAFVESLGPRGTLVRAVEPHSLYNEGKQRIVEAPEVTRCLLEWLKARTEQA